MGWKIGVAGKRTSGAPWLPKNCMNSCTCGVTSAPDLPRSGQAWTQLAVAGVRAPAWLAHLHNPFSHDESLELTLMRPPMGVYASHHTERISCIGSSNMERRQGKAHKGRELEAQGTWRKIHVSRPQCSRCLQCTVLRWVLPGRNGHSFHF